MGAVVEMLMIELFLLEMTLVNVRKPKEEVACFEYMDVCTYLLRRYLWMMLEILHGKMKFVAIVGGTTKNWDFVIHS